MNITNNGMQCGKSAQQKLKLGSEYAINIRAGLGRGATFSGCEKYRYTLWRDLNIQEYRCGPLFNRETILWIMLNPSTATDAILDPTVTRCRNYSNEWGYDKMVVCNLFAYRATDPKEMKAKGVEAIGPYNNGYLTAQAALADRIVCAWGVHGEFMGRAQYVVETLIGGYDLWCLGKTKSGHPKHPLYLSKTIEPQLYHAP